MDDLEKMLEEKPEEKKEEEKPEEKPKEPDASELLKQAELEKEQAIIARQEALKELKEAQRLKKAAGRLRKEVQPEEEEELPKIDLEDPSAKAWDKHIRDEVSPALLQIDKQKDEVRSAALRDFLEDKPVLAKDSVRLKSLLKTYQALSDGQITELTKEGITPFLEKAYAAENHERLFDIAKKNQVEQAQADALFSSPGISHGSSSFGGERKQRPALDSEATRVAVQMYGSVDKYWETKDAADKAGE